MSKRKSAFQNPEFAKFWDRISGNQGQAYKQYVVDPILLKWIGNLKGKSILDLGCGNGYMGKKFVAKGAKKVILCDYSEFNLANARKKNSSKKV